MAANIYEFLTTEATSSTTGGVNAAEGQDPSTVNNGVRAFKERIAEYLDDQGGVSTVAGTGDAITVTLASGITAYATGQHFMFKAGADNTGAATLNANAIGVKAIRKISGGTDVALAAGDIAEAARYEVVYDSAANAAAGAWILLTSTVADASTTVAGKVELATPTEAQTGTSTSLAVTPAGLYYPSGHLWGLTLSNNATDATNDIDIAVGTARDSTDAANIDLASALTKRLDAAWVVGTNQGGLDTGSIANATYHVWLIKRSDTGVVDVLFSTSATAPTMPTSYDYKRRIGSIIRSGAAILAFSQVGDDFLLKTSIADTTVFNPGITANTRVLSVPTGIKVFANIVVGAQVNAAAAATTAVLISSFDVLDVAADVTNATAVATKQAANNFCTAPALIRTATDGSVRSRLSASDAQTGLHIRTHGWTDTRGRMVT